MSPRRDLRRAAARLAAGLVSRDTRHGGQCRRVELGRGRLKYLGVSHELMLKSAHQSVVFSIYARVGRMGDVAELGVKTDAGAGLAMEGATHWRLLFVWCVGLNPRGATTSAQPRRPPPAPGS